MPELKEVFEMVSQKVEPDLDAWKQQEQRQRRTARNRRIGAFGLVAAIVTVLAVVSFGALREDPREVGSGPPLTPAALEGVWVRETGSRYVRFQADGTFAADNDDQLLFSGASAAMGTYELSDGTITFMTDDRSDFCRPGETWVWEAELVGEDEMEARIVEDGTGDCQLGAGLTWVWTRVDG